jgi:hypothetical protein
MLRSFLCLVGRRNQQRIEEAFVLKATVIASILDNV